MAKLVKVGDYWLDRQHLEENLFAINTDLDGSAYITLKDGRYIRLAGVRPDQVAALLNGGE